MIGSIIMIINGGGGGGSSSSSSSTVNVTITISIMTINRLHCLRPALYLGVLV